MKRLIISIFGIVLVIALTWGGLVMMKKFQPEAVVVPALRVPISVKTQIAQPQSVTLTIETQGTVEAYRPVALMAQVSGQIIEVSPSLKTGRFFKAGDVLVRLDPRDYESALSLARAELASQQLRLIEEEARAQQAKQDWKLFGEGEPQPLVMRVPQIEEAQAAVAAAVAKVEHALRDLERTEIKAPYDGLILAKKVDLGQIVNHSSGTIVADICSTDYVEIRLPITLQDLTLIGTQPYGNNLSLTLTADIERGSLSWEGWLDRLEGSIDRKSRLAYVVAKVPDPYHFNDQQMREPLRIGQFVQAKINAKTVDNVFVLPRSALRERNTLLIVGNDKRLYSRVVTVLRSDTKEIVVADGLEAGERICLSRIAFFVEGMTVAPTTKDT